MIQIIKQTSRFKKNYRLAMKRGYDPKLFAFVLNELVNERPLSKKHRDHALVGNYA